MILKFDEATHTYWINGIKVPSVTQVLREAGIIDHSKIPQDKLDIAMKFGIAVHKACELYDNHNLDWNKLDIKLKPYVNAWVLFIVETGFIVKQNEKPIGSEKYMVAGTPDRTGKLFNARADVEIKSTYAMDIQGLELQTGGYELIYNEGLYGINKIKKRIGVLLKPDGTYKIEPCKNKSDKFDFLVCLQMYNLKKKRGLIK